MKKTILIAAAFLFALGANAQQMQPLPNDPAVRVGTLDNGLTYYIRHNELPEHRAEFYLATNVGGIQETPDQDGLAHFLEHMCFNGTEHFPDKGILDWLRSIGAEFGRNVNASTGFEETQYMLNNIPVERTGVVDTCLMILCDYAHFVTNSTEEIDAERGVIREERRQRRNASWRAFEASLPYYFGDTKYATCTLIGSEENLMNFKPESLRNFYKTWYHPDMQAVVVVGDVDVDRTEAKIKEIFSVIPKEENPQAKEVIPFPANEDPVVGIITDPEMTSPTIEMIWKSEAAPEEYNATMIGEMQDYLKTLISQIMDERFSDITSKANAPYVSGGFYIGDLIYEAVEAAMGNVTLKEDNILGGFKDFYTEIERMRRYGFTSDEYDRAKTNILTSLENAVERASTRKNAQLVRPLLSNFFDKTPYMTPEDELSLGQQLLSMINVDVLNQVAPQLITDENLVVMYNGPQKDGIATPTAEQILAAIEEVKASDIQPLEGEAVASGFLDASKLKGSKVKSTGGGAYGTTLWTLKNGVNVFVLPTNHQKDQILFNLWREGGESLIPTEDLDSFDENVWGLFQRNSGVGEFSGTQASKMLTGKTVSVSPYINTLTNGISGASNRKDLETAMQLLYLQYVNPRFDEEEYNVGIEQLKGILPNFVTNPDFIMQKNFTDAYYGNNPRHQSISMETLDKANVATAEKDYKKLFNNAAGLNLAIVGDVDLNELKPLVEKYIGSIPKGKKKDAPHWVDNKDYPVTGIVTKHDNVKMETPKSTVLLAYNAPEDYDIADEAALDAIGYIMDMRYVNSLREEIGGTYGASAAAGQNKYPVGRRTIQVQFQCKPELCDTLLTVAKAQMEEFAQDGPTAEEFNMAKLNLQKNVPEKRISNSYWMGKIKDYYLGYGEEDKAYEEAVNALTAEKVQKAAQDILSAGNKFEYVMNPE